MATDNSASAFTAGEMKIVATMLKYGDIQTNFDKVANELGYKSANIAKTRWSQIKKKKFGNSSASTDGTAKSPATRTQGTKRVTTDEEGDDDEGTPVTTPVKRGRKSKVGKVESADSDCITDSKSTYIKPKVEQVEEDAML